MTLYYADETIKLYHGDCSEVAEWLEADVLVTDPPYGRKWSLHGGGVGRVGRRKAGIRNDSTTKIRDAALHRWTGKPAIVFGTWAEQIPHARQTLVWRKPADAGVIGSTTGYRTDTELIFLLGKWPVQGAQWSSVLISNSNKNAYLQPGMGHPHAKPVGLLEVLIARAPAGTIADPFAGSGSTLVAAKALGRHCVGVEIEERYCEIAARRLAQNVLESA